MISNAEAVARYRERYSERVRENRKKYRKTEWQTSITRRQTPEGWAKWAATRARYRAKKNGVEFSIDWTDLIPPKLCPVFGVELLLVGNTGKKKFDLHPNTASVDRLVNSKGYVKGNVRVISHRANLLKKDATIDELHKLVAYMVGG